MKRSTKIISMILAIVMVFSVIPMTASANAIKSSYNTVDKLIAMDSINDLLDYLVDQINANKNSLITPVLRIVFLAMNNEQINGYIGSKEVTKLSGKEASQVLIKWLDTDILPPLNEKVQSNSAISTVTSLGVSVDLHNVQAVFDTLAQLDTNLVVKGLRSTLLGDAGDLNVTAVTNKTVAGNEDGAVKAVIQFLKDNMSIVHKALTGSIDLGLVNNFFDVNEYISFIGDLPKLIKSYIYKLVDSDAAAGEFAEGKMGGDWEKSAYAGYTADELLGAALIKLINGTDGVISKTDAGAVTKKSFYDLLADYAEPVFDKYAIDPLNDLITKLNNWLAEQTNAELKALFKSPIAPLTTSTFSSIFADAKSTGLLEQLNNILLAALKHIFANNVYSAANLTAGGNENLNENLTKIARYALPILVKLEDMMGYTFPDEIKNADPAKLSLADMATYILKPFFENWFGASDNFDKAVVNSAASLPALAVLAVNYTATNKEWLNLDYDFGTVAANDIKDIKEDAATDKVLATAAGIAIGALKYNADKIHFTATVSGTDWVADFNEIEKWGLEFIDGLPALVRTHDLKNQNGYGAFYKLNVVLNELIDFSFLNDVNSTTFKLDLETLLTSLCAKLYNFDVAGIIHIFEKNSKSGNVLNGVLNTSVIGMVDRILTALFEHNGKKTAGDSDPVPAAGKKQCTHTTSTHYEYCQTCGAYYADPVVNETKLSRPTHNYVKESETQKEVAPTASTCKFTTTIVSVCTKCGDKQTETKKSGHTAAVKEEDGYKITYCSVCNTEIKKEKIGGDEPVTPPEENIMMGDVDGDTKISAADARLALRASVKLEKFWNQPDDAKFKASDTDKDGKITAGDARKILRVSVKLDKFD